jgi:hypothetical protein
VTGQALAEGSIGAVAGGMLVTLRSGTGTCPCRRFASAVNRLVGATRAGRVRQGSCAQLE